MNIKTVFNYEIPMGTCLVCEKQEQPIIRSLNESSICINNECSMYVNPQKLRNWKPKL